MSAVMELVEIKSKFEREFRRLRLALVSFSVHSIRASRIVVQ